MKYEEIVKRYKEGTLETENLKSKLEVSKALKPRSIYQMFDELQYIYANDIAEIIKQIPEKEGSLKKFDLNLKNYLTNSYSNLIQEINDTNAWNIINLKKEDYSNKKFESLSISGKFSMINELLKEYYDFLDYQNVINLLYDFDKNPDTIDEQTLQLMSFFYEIYKRIPNEKVKYWILYLEKDYLREIINFKKEKDVSFEVFITNNDNKNVLKRYMFLKKIYNPEDYEEFVDVVLLASNTTKLSKIDSLYIFSRIGIIDKEKEYLSLEIENMKALQDKFNNMEKISEEINERKLKEEEEKRKQEEEERKALLERTGQLEVEKQKKEQERLIDNNEGYTGEFDKEISKLKNTTYVKESVYPVFLSWFDREDISLEKRLGKQKMKNFFDKLKKIEKETGRRVSLFLITNADQEVTKNRFNSLKQSSKEAGLPRLVEGAFGGYSSFRVDENGNIHKISELSIENREKILSLLERNFDVSFPREMIDETENNYIRYKLPNLSNENLTTSYLNFLIRKLIQNPKVSRQPLNFQPIIRKNEISIDVMLSSQVIGIKKLKEYYKAKYYIEKGKSSVVDVNEIDEFLKEKEDRINL